MTANRVVLLAGQRCRYFPQIACERSEIRGQTPDTLVVAFLVAQHMTRDRQCVSLRTPTERRFEQQDRVDHDGDAFDPHDAVRGDRHPEV